MHGYIRYNNMTVSELRKHIIDRLTPAVGVTEAVAMMREMFLKLKGYKSVDIALYGNRTVLQESVCVADGWCERVIAGEPLQYILGSAYFMGMEFVVSPAVLIPRPETAGLVDMIVDRYADRTAVRVLDVGTGSGCIAIALARALRFASVDAIDISAPALSVAGENAAKMRVDISFQQKDAFALSMKTLPGPYDVIVSNPPYIAQHERADMNPRVYANEPAQALFVPDSDPLIFYRAIAGYALQALDADGTLYFEINPLYSEQLRSMLAAQGWRDVDIIRDYKGNYRFAVCRI